MPILLLTKSQTKALEDLYQALTEATETGLFDRLCGECEPDTINAFCDLIKEHRG